MCPRCRAERLGRRVRWRPGRRLTSPPSWSAAISSRGRPPARAAAWSRAVRRVSWGALRTLPEKRITPPDLAGPDAGQEGPLGRRAAEGDDHPLPDHLRPSRELPRRRSPRPASSRPPGERCSRSARVRGRRGTGAVWTTIASYGRPKRLADKPHSGCASAPMRAAHDRSSVAVMAQRLSVRKARLALIVLAALTLAACGGAPTGQASRVPSAAAITHAHAAPAGRWRAVVDVSVATLWAKPAALRPMDRPSAANPVDIPLWLSRMTTGDRRWLVGRVQTQALYGSVVTVLRQHGRWSYRRRARSGHAARPARLPGVASHASAHGQPVAASASRVEPRRGRPGQDGVAPRSRDARTQDPGLVRYAPHGRRPVGRVRRGGHAARRAARDPNPERGRVPIGQCHPNPHRRGRRPGRQALPRPRLSMGRHVRLRV